MDISRNATNIAYFHLPGLFEFYDFYKVFLELFYSHREYFYDWCEIGSIYGSPEGVLWGGGRIGAGVANPYEVLSLMNKYSVSARLTFSNSLLRAEHLADEECNFLCTIFNSIKGFTNNSNTITNVSDSIKNATSCVKNGVIIHSDLLLAHLQKFYPNLYLVSSTTKVLTAFTDLYHELARPEFKYVVPDFRLNKAFSNLEKLPQELKDKVEFLCNECCWIGCKDRKQCYENVSRRNIGESCSEHICKAPNSKLGYRFSRAMEGPSFISIDDITNKYMPMGFKNFKIEGRELGSALLLEFLLYYMTKQKYQLLVREEIYLDSTLDLF